MTNSSMPEAHLAIKALKPNHETNSLIFESIDDIVHCHFRDYKMLLITVAVQMVEV